MTRPTQFLALLVLPLFLLSCGRLGSSEVPPTLEAYSTTAPKLIIPGPTATLPPQPTLLPTPTLAFKPDPTAEAEVPATETAVPEPTAGPLLALSVPAANVRSGPGIDYAIIGVVNRDDTTPVIGVSDGGGWINILLPDGGDGWVGSSVATIVQP